MTDAYEVRTAAWRKIRTVAWFLYGRPDCVMSHLDVLNRLIAVVDFGD